MTRHTRNVAFALLGLAPALVAWSGAAYQLSLVTPKSRLWVEGTSTVRGFTCKAATFDVGVDASAPAAAAAILNGEKAVTSVTVTVPTAKLDCGNGTMNEHMLKALKAKDAPTIEFALSSYEMVKGTSGMQGKLTGTLTMGGVKKPITLDAIATEDPAGLRVAGTHEVRMTEFGLKPPTLMMGTMKVNERVKVNFDLYLKS
jgi:polyisoprenoid-binding protein YceI